MATLTQKLKQIAACLLVLLGFAITIGPTTSVHAAGGCSGSTAPAGTNCANIPLGCPGSSKLGPVIPTANLLCPYSPSIGSTYSCPGASCTFQDTKTVTSGRHYCGDPPGVTTSINIGCEGKGNPILDMLFAFVRFLSAGVALVIVGSMIWAGIQYTSSRGDPQATAKAVSRIQSNVVALLIFIFAYAMLNYVIPGAVLK